MARDDKVARWDSFTEEERAHICLGICTFIMVQVAENMTQGGGTDPAEDRRVLDEVLMGAELVSQVNESMGSEGVDTDTLVRMQAMRELLTDKIEARGGEA